MGNYMEPVLSEEQLAAYLDGMLTTEESHMVEELIESDYGMQEIQDAIDEVDAVYTYTVDEEVPIECLSDDFTLPVVDDYQQSYDTDDDSEEDYLDYSDETQEMEDDAFNDNDFGDLSF